MATRVAHTVDPSWWTSASFNGRPMREILREREFGAVFGFLGARGWSRSAIAAATGLSENRVRAVTLGSQRITSYEVLERAADGLRIDRGLVGLAYVEAPADGSGQASGACQLGSAGVGATDSASADAIAVPRRAIPDTRRDRRTSPTGATVKGVLVDGGRLFQLPPDIADFTGRDQAAAELIGLVAADPGPAVAVAVVSGKGGVGKTTLAVHVAHGVRRYFPDGQLYVDLQGVQTQPADPGQVLGRFLNELGLDAQSIPDRMEDRARLYRAQLANRGVLIVLDNAADEAQVRPLLPGDPQCAVIVTSRRRLIGLDSVRQIPLDVMTADQASELLTLVVGEQRTAAEPDALRAVVRHCGRLPLALRMAGARLASRQTESLDSFARRLRDERARLDLLKAGDRAVRTTFALSYQGCDDELRRAFRLLSVLESPSVAAWALAVLADISVEQADNLVEQLVDVELLEIAADDPVGGRRYRFHDLVRVFARECLLRDEPPDARVLAAERLLAAYVDLGVHAAALLEPGGLEEPADAVPAALAAVRRDPRAWFQAERSSFVRGVSLASELALYDLSWRLAELLPALFRWQSDWGDWAGTHHIGLDAAQRCGSMQGEGRIRCSLGLLYRAQGRFAEAIAEFERSGQIFTELGDELRTAVASRQLGDTYRYTGGLDDGVAAFTASLAVFEQHGCTRMTAGALNGLGDIYRGLSRWDESATCFRRCIDLYESLGDDLAVARAKVRFGIVYRDRCLHDEAERLYRDGLATLRRLTDRRWEARVLRHLAIVHRNTGRLTTALQQFANALAIFAELADDRGVAVTTRNIGDAHRYRGDLDAAHHHLSDTLSRFRDLADERWTARTLTGLADVHRQRQEWEPAAEKLEVALTTYDKINDVPGQARALREWGILHRDQGRWDDSIATLRRSEDIFTSLGDQVWAARAIAGRAATLQQAGDGSWSVVRGEAERICRASGATSNGQVRLWLHEW